MSCEILSLTQCPVWYFGDSSHANTFSFIWITSTIPTALSAAIFKTELPTGAVGNKLLCFNLPKTDEKQIQLVSSR